MNVGDKLFNFKLPDSEGKIYSNYDFADKNAFLLVVTCNHCPKSQAYWQRLIKLYKNYEEDSLGIIAINPNDPSQQPMDSVQGMRDLIKSYKLPFVYLVDETQEVTKKLGATRTPEVFLFNSKRELVYKGAIDDNWENEASVMQVYLEDAIECSLDGLEVDYPEIPPVGCSIKWKIGNEPG